MSWKVLITARTFQDDSESAKELLKNAGCEVIVPPKFGPLVSSELLPKLEGVDAVLCSPDDYSEAVLASTSASRLKIISR